MSSQASFLGLSFLGRCPKQGQFSPSPGLSLFSRTSCRGSSVALGLLSSGLPSFIVPSSWAILKKASYGGVLEVVVVVMCRLFWIILFSLVILQDGVEVAYPDDAESEFFIEV